MASMSRRVFLKCVGAAALAFAFLPELVIGFLLLAILALLGVYFLPGCLVALLQVVVFGLQPGLFVL